jgi:phosphoserine phosphatase RsbU/P
MSSKSLAYRLGLYISLAVLLVFMVFISLILRFHFSTTTKSNENKAMLQSSEVFWNIKDIVGRAYDISASVSKQSALYRNRVGMEAYLSGIISGNAFLQSVELHLFDMSSGHGDSTFMVSRREGKITFYTGENAEKACIREDSLKRYVADPRREGWSEPFRLSPEGGICTVYSLPFEHPGSQGNDRYSGLVRCVVPVGFLADLINRHKIWGNGYAFIASPKGTYMTYPQKEYVMNRNIFAVYYDNKKNNASEFQKFMKGESVHLVVYPPALNYKKAWSFSAVIPEHNCNWILVSTVPFSQLHLNIFSLMIKMTAILLLLEIVIFFMVFYMSRRILKPLTMVSDALHNFSIELLDQHPGTRNETVALQKSLDRLQERYAKYKKTEAENALKGSRMMSDLALASEIQQSIIPRTGNYSLHNSGITIHTVFRPAHLISGDLYDFFMVDDKRLLITIGDVSGGGIPAALFMGVAHTYIRSNSSYNTAKEIVFQVNKQLCKNNSNQFFLTLFLGILDIRKGVLNYCNAGHSPSFLIPGNGKPQELNDQHGLPLGLYPEKEYFDSEITIHKGDALILYTDGITERMNEKGEFFGIAELHSLIAYTRGKSPEETALLIMQKVDQFGSGVPQHNDLSLMVLNYS